MREGVFVRRRVSHRAVPVGALPGFIFWLEVSLWWGTLGVVSVPEVPPLAPFALAAPVSGVEGAAVLPADVPSGPGALTPGGLDDAFDELSAA